MGNCIVSVHVTGCHHNQLEYDIDQMAAAFVDDLLRKGHNVTAAYLTTGGEYDLTNRAARFPLKTAGAGA